MSEIATTEEMLACNEAMREMGWDPADEDDSFVLRRMWMAGRDWHAARADRAALEAEVARLREALSFYADIREYNVVAGDPSGSDPPIIVGDRGGRARAALAAPAERRGEG